PDSGDSTKFTWELTPGDEAEEAVLVLSLSAAVHLGEIPADIRASSAYRIAPVDNATPHYDVIGSPESLRSAERALRGVLADIEHHHKQICRLHVLGAAPLSACIALGRALTRGVHPALVLYDRVDNTYVQALEIN
ncbi:MAG: SAVED domain-containing protein, partial [Microthrixaceae bacterium]|nr:SAVED domain-containing protein [Microthrixaceae bacterium]